MTEDEVIGWHHRLNGHEWVNSRSWWWTGRPCVQQCVVTQRVGHDWALNWTELNALVEIIPPYQSTIVFHFLLSPNAILCHFLNLLLITYCTTLPDLVKDVIILVILSRSLFTGFRACVLCVSAADPWVFSGFTLSYWLHTDITLKSRWFNWTQKLVTGSKHLA